MISINETEALVEVIASSSWNCFPVLKELSARNGDGFILVFSFDSASSFDHLLVEYNQLCRAKLATNFPMVILGVIPSHHSSLSSLSSSSTWEVAEKDAKSFASAVGAQVQKTIIF